MSLWQRRHRDRSRHDAVAEADGLVDEIGNVEVFAAIEIIVGFQMPSRRGGATIAQLPAFYAVLKVFSPCQAACRAVPYAKRHHVGVRTGGGGDDRSHSIDAVDQVGEGEVGVAFSDIRGKAAVKHRRMPTHSGCIPRRHDDGGTDSRPPASIGNRDRLHPYAGLAGGNHRHIVDKGLFPTRRVSHEGHSHTVSTPLVQADSEGLVCRYAVADGKDCLPLGTDSVDCVD